MLRGDEVGSMGKLASGSLAAASIEGAGCSVSMILNVGEKEGWRLR